MTAPEPMDRDAILEGVFRLGAITAAERKAYLVALTDQTGHWARSVTDDELNATSRALAQGVFEAALEEGWHPGIADYLEATARVLLGETQQRGQVLEAHVRLDGALDPEALDDLVHWLPLWFRSAGFGYLSAHEIAWLQAREASNDPGVASETWPLHVAEADATLRQMLRRYRNAHRAVVVVDPRGELRPGSAMASAPLILTLGAAHGQWGK